MLIFCWIFLTNNNIKGWEGKKKNCLIYQIPHASVTAGADLASSARGVQVFHGVVHEGVKGPFIRRRVTRQGELIAHAGGTNKRSVYIEPSYSAFAA